jgi:hypothetical protein
MSTKTIFWGEPVVRPEANDIAEVLEDAAAIIDRVGWVKGALDREEHGEVVGYCAVGAIGMATTGQSRSNNVLAGCAQLVLSSWLREHELLGKVQALPLWNDERTRTKEEVIEAMTLVAKALRNGQLW